MSGHLNFSDGQFSDGSRRRSTSRGTRLAKELAQGCDLVLADGLPVDLCRFGLASFEAWCGVYELVSAENSVRDKYG
jgi:hypothetical protein